MCAAAVDVARSALLEEAEPALVGEPVGQVADGPLVVTHYFAGFVPGYTGWQWAVTVSRAPDSEHVTVDETALLPDGDALLAPAWVPWKQRVQSGDLGAGDVLVTEPDDPRLIPGLSENDEPEPDDDLKPVQWELGLGRPRILSPEGRRDAAHRWYREVGPRAAIARATHLNCSSCGFLLTIGGPLGQAFGVCANGYSPVDGRIVALTFGCGAHSETVQVPSVAVADTVVDEMSYDDLRDVEVPPEAAEQPTADAPAAQDGPAEEPTAEAPETEPEAPGGAPETEPEAPGGAPETDQQQVEEDA